MRLATRTALVAFAFALAAGTASAQNDVTFQVDMSSFITSCQFDVAGAVPADTVFVRGTFNGFSKANPLADGDGDGVYTATVSIPEGAIDYKFYTNDEGALGWENDANDGGPNGNRDYTVTAGAQTIDVATYNKDVVDSCTTGDTYDVTFQVDMGDFIDSCQFDPAEDGVLVRGSFNGYGETNPLTDDNEDGVYTTTIALPAGNVSYKFFANNELSWEDNVNDGGANGNDRDYVVTTDASQTIPVVTYNRTPTDACGQTEQVYEVTFVVDMSTQISRGAFDPMTDEVAVGSDFTGWDGATAFQLAPESDNPNIYSGTVTETFAVPTESLSFKFVILSPNGSGGFDITNYEQPRASVSPTQGGNDGANRLLILTGDEPTDGTTGNRFLTYDNNEDDLDFVTYSDADPSLLLTEAATVTYVVDLRPAYYALADAGTLPNGITSISGVFMNGPLFGESDQADGPGVDTVNDWLDWTPEALGGVTARQLGNFNAADSTYSITLTYSAGAFNVLQGKLSVGGPDNEAGGFDDKFVAISPGTQTVNLIYGAQRKSNGTFSDNTDSFDAYDAYIAVDNQATPPTATVVRRGGENDLAVANEAGPGQAGALSLGAAYPNPAAGVARLDVTAALGELVTVGVYDVMGRRVVTVVQDALVSGTRTVTVDTSTLAPGLYVVRAEAGGSVVTRRLTVVR